MPTYPTFLSLMWLFHNLIRYSPILIRYSPIPFSLCLSLSLSLSPTFFHSISTPKPLSLFAIPYPHSLHLHSVTTSLNQYHFLKPSTTSNLIQVCAN